MFVPEAALIALREGLEAFLIVGILLGFVAKLGRPFARRWVWIGLAAGIAASVAIGLLVQFLLLEPFENKGGAQWFELVASLVAVGVLTYMVFWMWKHTRHLMVTLRERIGDALNRNTLWVIAVLVFFSVLREGLEVVLFYGALAGRNSPFDLVWSGLVGMAVSVGIVVMILKTTTSFNLQKFFAITGLLLVFIAAGLLVHGVHAATDLGLLPTMGALWDTGEVLSDDGAAGRILHALFGYAAAPNLLQAVLYFGYLFGVGIPYLASLGTFRRAATKAPRKGAVAAAALVVWLATVATAWGAANPLHAEHGGHGGSPEHADPHDYGDEFFQALEAASAYDGRIGILVRDHGEIVHYNATTYESVKEFVRHFWPYTGLPMEVLGVDQGTYFIDEAHPFDPEPRADAVLVDAWLNRWRLPAGTVTDLPETGLLCQTRPEDRVYFVPGAGPGMGEGDLFELCGLGAYRDWLKMDNHSPRYEQGAPSWVWLEHHLKLHFGDKIVVAFAHGHDPKVNANESLEAAARFLVSANVTVVLDAYQSSIHSDAMNTCMMAPHAEHALREAGFRGAIRPVGPSGLGPIWSRAVAERAEELLVESEGPAAIHLTQHGSRPGSKNPCDTGIDQYHENARKQFEAASAQVRERLKARGNVTIRHVYGQGAAATGDGVLSPLEALELDRQHGIRTSIFLPFEFWGDGVDTLVYLRESLGLKPAESPYYDSNFETRFVFHGASVVVASGEFHTDAKSEALLHEIAAAVRDLASAT